MDPDFKDLLPWQEMSRLVKRLEDFMNSWCSVGYPGVTARFENLEQPIKDLVLRISNLEAAVYQLETDREKHWEAINDLQSYHN